MSQWTTSSLRRPEERLKPDQKLISQKETTQKSEAALGWLAFTFIVWRKPPAMLVVQESLQRGKQKDLPSGKLSVGFPTTQKEPGRYPNEKGQ